MITFNDLMDQIEIQGAVKVQKWNEATNDFDVMYETDEYEHALVNKDYDWMQSEIKYMYSVQQYTRNNVLSPQIVIEIE